MDCSYQRNAIPAASKQAGIPRALNDPIPLHIEVGRRRHGKGDCSFPVPERLAGRVLSLPKHPYLDDAAIERIAGIVRRAA